MKIKTITLQCTDNCGSTLQAYALQKYLTILGNDVEIIDYRPKYLFENGNKIKTLIFKTLFPFRYYRKLKKLKKFENENLNLTLDKYFSNENLISNAPIADVFFTGSDQIWNPSYKCGRDLSYYLNFVKNGKKLSYAASLGKDNFNNEEISFLQNSINGFSAISVREKPSVNFLEKELKQKSTFVCDPVFLLEKSNYEKIATKPKYTKYLLVYLVQESELLNKLINEIKFKFNLQVIQIGGFRKQCKCDIHIKDLAPDEFLGFLSHANYIIASSFHATAFSHIFNKNFAIVLPNKNSMRIESILNESGLMDRIVHNANEIKNALFEIDYKKIDISSYISHSKEWLINSLKECEKNDNL